MISLIFHTLSDILMTQHTLLKIDIVYFSDIEGGGHGFCNAVDIISKCVSIKKKTF